MTRLLVRVLRWPVFAVFVLLALPVFADTLIAGRDYTTIAHPHLWQPEDERIEVVEVFAYTCPACAAVQSKVAAWAAALPEDVRFHYVPAPTHDDVWMRACFAAESLGALERTHAATFQAFHHDALLPKNPSMLEMVTFYTQLGLDGEALGTAMLSDETNQHIARARAFLMATGVRGTPSLIVAGRYLVQGPHFDAVLTNASALIARERAARP